MTRPSQPCFVSRARSHGNGRKGLTAPVTMRHGQAAVNYLYSFRRHPQQRIYFVSPVHKGQMVCVGHGDHSSERLLEFPDNEQLSGLGATMDPERPRFVLFAFSFPYCMVSTWPSRELYGWLARWHGDLRVYATRTSCNSIKKH